jgi:hypothetical protein
MSLVEKIVEKVKSLPEDKQIEILDFVDFLSRKVEEEERLWSKFSLESAMRGLESEEPLYTLEDIKERYR